MSSQPLPGDAAPNGAERSRPVIRHRVWFWSLVALSLVAVALGVTLLVFERQDAGGGAALPQPKAQAPQPAADFRLTTTDGRRIGPADLRGQVVLLNFWATWCPPCKAEMPDLEALYRDNGGKHNFIVVGIDVEESQDAVQAFGRQFGLTFPLLADADGAVSNSTYGVRALPTSLIIDRTGNVRYRWTGQQSRQTMLDMLKNVW
ncbi:MAG TPA: TlpA disulfide reductase family protein [Anaerolineae bacterium]